MKRDPTFITKRRQPPDLSSEILEKRIRCSLNELLMVQLMSGKEKLALTQINGLDNNPYTIQIQLHKIKNTMNTSLPTKISSY